MATIPIEVIVQDAEAPIVPSEDGTNTNITVPDTGTISSSGETSSSASSIILPAILLVLAIGSIVAILIHKYHKQKKDKTSKKEKLAVATSSTIAVLAATVLVGNLILPATKAATSDTVDGITPAEDKISIVVTRDGGEAEASIESNATITSTSDFGYKVLLSMAEGIETSNLYLNGDTASEHYIASTESTELTDNTWGYALTGDGEYSAVPLLDNAVVVAQGNEPVEAEDLSIYYGVKVSSTLPAGTYSGGEVEYSLQASTGFPDSLVYMQDMTSAICNAAPTPGNSVTDPVPTATLIDSRDYKTYTIAKLADDKCWMTQNLDLDIDEGTELTPENTDIVENWISNLQSRDPGDIYYYTSNDNDGDIVYNSLEECEKAGHTDCPHYHAGNYYTWTMATAGGTQLQNGGNLPNSICPAGWKLPESVFSYTNPSSEMADAIRSYNNVLEETMTRGCGGSCAYYAYSADGLNAIRMNPFYLVRAGMYYYSTLSGDGTSGAYWTNAYTSGGSAGWMSFGDDGVYPSREGSRGYSSSVRCVAE